MKKKNKKGFTLIELLAVILILAIITLIAVPLVSNMVEVSNRNAAICSVNSYINSIETVTSKYLLKNNDSISGSYKVNESELNNKNNNISFNLDIKGIVPTGGTVNINNEGLVTSASLMIKKYYCSYDNENGAICDNEVYSSKNTSKVDMDYEDSLEVLFNPERGFSPYSSIKFNDSMTNVYETNYNMVSDIVKFPSFTSPHSLENIIIYITYYKDKDFESDFVTKLNNIFDIYRKHNKKVIVRFAYTRNENEDNDPVDFNQTIRHIDQLEPFFKANEDIIIVNQIGFVGLWGESHGTKNATLDNIKRITEELLKVTPKSIQTAIRTLKKYNYYDGNNKDRMTIYNDAFLADKSDMGSYQNRTEDLKTIKEIVKNKYFGGEALIGDETQNGMENAQYEMKLLGIDYLNPLFGGADDYGIFEKWKSTKVTDSIDKLYAKNNKNYYEYLENTLGYRFKFDNIDIDKKSTDGYLNMKLTISNNGFGKLVRNKNVYLLLEKDGSYYKNRVNIDLTTINSFSTKDFEIKMQLPKINGDYRVYLMITDSSDSLKNCIEYNIKFANKNIYNSSFGANYITTVNINSNEVNQIFMQVNGMTVNEYENKILEIKKVIDGKITNSYEWIDSNLVYNKENKIYLDFKNNNFTFFITGNNISSYNLYLNTTENKIDYLIQDGLLYKGVKKDWNWTKLSSSDINVKYTDTGIEGSIPLSLLGISSLNDLNQIIVDYNEDGDDYTYANSDSNYNKNIVLVDGKLTTTSEYGNYLLKELGITIYTKLFSNKLYVYMTKSDMSDVYTQTIFINMDNTSHGSYTYKIQSQGIRDTVGEIMYGLNRVIDDGLEIEIPLSYLNNIDMKNIKSIGFQFINSNWDDIGTVWLDNPYK